MENNLRKRRRTLQSHGSIDFFYDVVQWTIPLDESAPAYKKLKKGNPIQSPHFSFNKIQEWQLEMRLEMNKILFNLLMTDHFIVAHLGCKIKDGFVREDPGHPRSLGLQKSDELMASGVLTATCRVEREKRRGTVKKVGEPVLFRVLENTSRNIFGVVDHFSEMVEWKIPDFLSLQPSRLESPPFPLAGSQWRLTVYLDGLKSDSYLSVYLRPEVCNTSNKAVFYIGLLTLNYTALQEIKRGDTEDSNIAKAGGGWGWSRFLSLEELEKGRFVTPSSKSLVVTCRIERTATSTSSNVSRLPLPSRSLVNPVPSTSSQPSPVDPETEVSPPQERLLVDLENLSSDLKDLLSSGRTWDFTISVQGKEFRAHRAILSARSPVFRHMLEHDTPEAQSGIVNVSDCHRDSFGQFMDFLYTGKIEDMSFEAALHLYATAEKYDVRRLKSFCADYLKQNLSV